MSICTEVMSARPSHLSAPPARMPACAPSAIGLAPSAHAPAATPGKPSRFTPAVSDGALEAASSECVCVAPFSAPFGGFCLQTRSSASPAGEGGRSVCRRSGTSGAQLGPKARRHRRGPVSQARTVRSRVPPSRPAPSPPRRNALRCIRGGMGDCGMGKGGGVSTISNCCNPDRYNEPRYTDKASYRELRSLPTYKLN